MSFPIEPTKGLGDFFDSIWRDTEGWVYLPSRKGLGKDAIWSKTFYEWPKNRSHVVDHVLFNSQTKDVYFSPVVWSKPVLERQHIKGSWVLYADFDGNPPEDWSIEAPPEAHGAAPGHPSIVVQTSTETHQHVYWRLDEFQSDLTFVENTNRAIAYAYSADTSGWDVEQVLRPPFSTNYKHNLPVVISSFDLTDYPADSFTSFKPVKQLINEGVDETNLPDPLQLIGKYTWDSDTLDLLQKDVDIKIDKSAALMRVGYKCAELGLSATEAYAVVLFLDDRLGKFVGRNDRKRRLLDIVNKALQKYPHKLEAPNFDGLTGDKTPVAENTQFVYGFKDFMAADFNIEWAIKDLMPLQGIGLIMSEPNVGKTQLLTHLGMCQALGKNFIGYDFEGKKRKGGMFSLEMGENGYFKLLATISKDYTAEEAVTLQENFKIIALGEPMPLDSASSAVAFFEKVIEENELEWVAIDSFSDAYTGKLSDDELTRKFFGYLAVVRKKFNLYMWLIHHSRKPQGDNKKVRTLADAFGSVYIGGKPDTILSLWEEEVGSGIISVAEVKNRYAEKAKLFKIKRTKNLNFERLDETPTFDGIVNDSAPLGISPPNSSGKDRKASNTGFGFPLS